MSISQKFSLVSMLSLCGALSMGAVGCAGSDSGRSSSARAKWVDSPSGGTTKGTTVSIPKLGVSLTTPDTLYVFKDCGEAGHGKAGPDRKWIPVFQCAGESHGSDDEYSENYTGDRVLTIYAAHKTELINERAVEMFRTRYESAGQNVSEIGFHDDYVAKEGRRGIEAVVEDMDGDGRMATHVSKWFYMAVGDVVFIMHTEYPSGTDVSGMMSDWGRIIWNFQLDEDGALFPDDVTEEEE